MIFTKGGTSVTGLVALYPGPDEEVTHWDTFNVTGDGTPKSFSNDVNTYNLYLKLRMTETVMESLRSFFKTTVKGRSLTFTVTPPTGVDIGLGASTAITTAHFNQSVLRFQRVAHNYYICDVVIYHQGS